MMGGQRDHYSKGIFGIAESEEETFLLCVDPHYASETPKMEETKKFVYWKSVADLEEGFYNIMLPLSYKRPR